MDINWGVLIGTLIASGAVGGLISEVVRGWYGSRTSKSVLQGEADRQDKGLAHAQRLQHAQQDHESAVQAKALDHERLLLEQQRAHERLSRSAEDHSRARDLFIGQAADVFEWVDYEWGSLYGPEVDYHPQFDPKPALTTQTEVIAALQWIELRHPTNSVRELAGSLRRTISGHYGTITPTGDGHHDIGTDPSDRQFTQWHSDAKALVEAIHEPPSSE